MLTYEYNA